MVSLCHFLKRYPDLQVLHVLFTDCHSVTDHGVEGVMDVLNSQVYLRKVGIDFGFDKVTNRSLMKIVQYIKTQLSLEKITLPSSGFMRWSEGIEDLERQRPNLRFKWLMNIVD